MKNPGAYYQKFRSQRGFTLVESLISVSIFVIIAGACFSSLVAGIKIWDANDTHTELEQHLRKAMDWIKQDLTQAGSSSVTNVPADGNSYTTITFTKGSSVSGGAITWSSSTTQFILSGTNLTRLTGSQTDTIASSIQSMTFIRQAASPNIVAVTLNAQKGSGAGTMSSSTTFQVELRN